ncbi:MAG: polysaccharide biosynthesis C-terminal domain-containing protein [Gaiellaceae bacterium]
MRGAGASEPLDAAAATTGATVLSGSAWKAASLALPQLYALVQSIVAARFLGPSGMGVQSFIAFSEIALVSLTSTGLSLSLMRYVGELLGRGRPGELRDLVSWGWRFQTIGAVLAGAALGAASLAGAHPRTAWALAAVAAVASVLHTVPSAVLIGAQRWRDASIVGLATGTVATGAIVAVLAAGGGITGMFAVEAVLAVVNLAWTGSLGRRALGRVASVPRVASASIRHGARSYALFGSATAIVTFIVWRRSELFFLQHYSASAQLAFYSIPFAVVTALTALPTSLGDVVSPAVATLFGAGATDRIGRGYGRGARLLLLVALPVTAAALALGPETLRVIWGRDYSKAAPVFLILVSPLPLIPLINFARSFLTGIGLIRVPLLIVALAGVLNVGLDFLLVPRYDAVGAAIANVSAQLAAGLPVLAYTRSQIGGVRWEAGALARTATASALAGAVAWAGVLLLGGAGGLLLGLLAGAVAFTALGALLRILPADDARWLDDAVGRRLGGVLGRTVRLWSRLPAPAVSGSEPTPRR